MPAAVSRILVLPVPRPTITLAGSCNLSRGYEDFKRGVRIFSDLRLSVSRPEGGEGEGLAPPTETKVDKCVIRQGALPTRRPFRPTINHVRLYQRVFRSSHSRRKALKGLSNGFFKPIFLLS